MKSHHECTAETPSSARRSVSPSCSNASAPEAKAVSPPCGGSALVGAGRQRARHRQRSSRRHQLRRWPLLQGAQVSTRSRGGA